MPHSVRITPEATDDLAAISAYIARDSPTASLRFIERLQQRIGLLKHFPGRHGKAAEAELFGVDLREMVHGMYRVLDTFDDREVVVHAVCAAGRAARCVQVSARWSKRPTILSITHNFFA